VFARFLGLKMISPRGLHRSMQNEPLTAVDVNPRSSWVAAHVPGALNLDPDRFSGGDLPPDKDSMLVFYCSTYMCSKAPRAARRATAMGYRRVHVMSAGISGWLRAGLFTESGEAHARLHTGCPE
jgi:rhodanese-related sulfurtransferase